MELRGTDAHKQSEKENNGLEGEEEAGWSGQAGSVIITAAKAAANVGNKAENGSLESPNSSE